MVTDTAFNPEKLEQPSVLIIQEMEEMRLDLNSRLFAVLLVVVVLSPTCVAALAPLDTAYCGDAVCAPYATIKSVGSVNPYVLKGVPFEISVEADVIASEYATYGFYITYAAAGKYDSWPITGGYMSSILYGSGWFAQTGPGYGSMYYCPTSKKVSITLNELGRVPLHLVFFHMSNIDWNKDGGWHQYVYGSTLGKPVPLGNTLATRDFEVNVLASLPSVSISDVQYVKPPDSITEGETTPVVVKVSYNLPEAMTLQFDINDLATGGTVGSWDSTQKLSGTGVFTSSPIKITSFAPSSMDASRAGDWNLRVQVSAESTLGLAAKDTEDFTIKVVAKASATPPDVDIAKVEYVKSPETITLGEPTPVIVTAEYRNLQPSSKLLLWFKDVDTGQGITGAVASTILPASGTYVFPRAQLTASKTGDWHLQAVVEVNAVGESTATSSFTIKVVAPTASAQAQITDVDYVASPETVLVGESTPVVVTVKYQNLVPGTKLTLNIIDQAYTFYSRISDQIVGSTTSTALTGSGTYTFQPVSIKPVRAGDWSLQAEVRLGDHMLISNGFTIKVVSATSTSAPKVKIVDVKYAEPPEKVKVGRPTSVQVAIQYYDLAPGTRLTLEITEEGRSLATSSSPPLTGSGTYVFDVDIMPKRTGEWRLVAEVSGERATLTILVVS